MDSNTITSNLFGAIDNIIHSRLKELQYDKTEICTIVDDSKAANGEYRVTNGSVTYTAKSENDSYKKDDQVRVSYVNGDATQEKFIIGKYVGQDSNVPITYMDPLDSVMQMTGNMLGEGNSGTYGLIATGLQAEDPKLQCDLPIISLNQGQQSLINTKIYDTLFIQAEFKTLLSGYNIVSGNYGLFVRLGQSTTDSEGNKTFASTLDCVLDSSKMLGDPYNFGIYTKQAAKFDVSELGVINSIQVYFYQQSNFQHNTYSLEPVDIGAPIGGSNNLLVKNVVVGFGCDVTKVEDDTLKLFTLGSTEYDKNQTNTDRKRTLTFTWYNKNDNGQYIGFSDGEVAETASAQEININTQNVEINNKNIKFIDESQYGEAISAQARLLEQVDYNIPMDENGLDTVAKLKSEYNKLIKANSLISSDISQTMTKFARYCDLAAMSDIMSSIKSVIGQVEEKNTQIKNMYNEYMEALNHAAAKYNKLPENAVEANLEFIVKPEDIKSSVALTSVDNLTTYLQNLKNVFYGEGNILLPDLYNSIQTQYSGYKGVYDNYSNKIIALLNEVENYYNIAIEILGDVKKNIEAYWNDGYEFDQWMEEDFSQYDNAYCVYWYRANKFAAGDLYASKGWERIPETGYASYETIDVELRPEQQQEQYKVILFFNHTKHESNVLTFENLTDLDDERASLSDYIEIAHGNNSRESYQSYSEANTLLNSADAYVVRELIAAFVDVDAGEIETESEDFILKDAQIFWYVPMESTMLNYDLNDLHKISIRKDDTYNDFTCDGGTKVSDKYKSEDQKIGYYGFYKKIQNEEDMKFSYRIKNYYLQSASQNTILCKVKKGEFTYEGTVSMVFSSYGNSGTDYSITIAPHGRQAAITPSNTEASIDISTGNITHPANPFRLDITLYDSQNNEIEIPSGAKVNILQSEIFYTLTDIMKDEITKQYYCDLYYHNTTNSNCICGILQVSIPGMYHTAEGNDNTVNLTAFYPIPYSAGIEYYIEGATTVVYDSQGGSPVYYKDPYKIFAQSNGDGNDQIPQGQWKMVYTHGSTTNIYPFMPILTSANKLKPCSMWIDGGDTNTIIDEDTNKSVTTKYYACVQYTTEDDLVLWSQPILLMQNRYESPMLNAWDGSFQIDEENGTILSTMVGAGRKNINNQFEGVLMGDVGGAAGIATGNHTGLGIYGFHNGQQSFGFNIDGTAFIGKSKAGRIVFDGNTGTIKSASYDYPDAAGTNIDVDEGIIHLRGLKGLLEDYPDQRAEVYLSPGHQKYDNEGKALDEYEDYFRIKSIKGEDLIRIGKDEYFLKTDNFDGESQGVKLDLANGKLIGYNFSLQALGENNSGVIIDSSGNPYLQINNNEGNILLKASKTEFFLKSATGDIEFDIANSTLVAKKFTLDAINGGTGIYFSNEGSTNKPFLKIVSTFEDSVKTLLHIDKDNFYLQSHDWSEGDKTGTQISLMPKENESTLKSYNFNLTAFHNNNNEQFIQINSIDMDNPFNVNNKFKIAWDGSFSINDGVFSVDAEGNAKVIGNITAGEGSIGGWYINNNALLTKSIYTNNAEIIDGTISGIISANENFEFSQDDASWTIDIMAESLITHQDSPINQNSPIKFFAGWNPKGSEDLNGNILHIKNNANFVVLDDGSLYAKNANIQGTITAQNGLIGGWEITPTQLKNYSGERDENGYYLNSFCMQVAGNGAANALAIGRANENWWGHAAFRVTVDGKLYATNAEISGNITASDGYIGDFTIKDGSLKWINTNNIDSPNVEFKTNFNTTEKNAFFGQNGLVILNRYFSDSSQTTQMSSKSIQIQYDQILFREVDRNAQINVTNSIEINDGKVHLEGTWWASNDKVITSDRNQKNSISSLTQQYDILFDALEPRLFKYNNSLSNRYHVGYIAQEVDNAIKSASLDRQNFAAICIQNEGRSNESWGLRYGEFISLNTWQIQKLKSRVKILEDEIIELKKIIKG